MAEQRMSQPGMTHMSTTEPEAVGSWFRHGSVGRAVRGWFTSSYRLKSHPTRLLFLVEISQAKHSSLFLRIDGVAK